MSKSISVAFFWDISAMDRKYFLASLDKGDAEWLWKTVHALFDKEGDDFFPETQNDDVKKGEAMRCQK